MPSSDFIYFPDRNFIATPADIGLAHQEITFSAGKRKLHGWFLPHPNAEATFLFFHGNAGNISHRLEKLKILHELGAATFIIDYSGYGLSEGKPSEKNLYEDGLAAYEALPTKEKIIFYGESLGSAVAIELALKKPPAGSGLAGLILEGAFTSLKAIAKRHMPFLAPLAGNQFNNLEKIAQIKVPLLMIHPTNDEICPFEEAQALYEKAMPPKSHCWLEQGGHNDAFIVDLENYKNGLKEFLKQFAMGTQRHAGTNVV